MLVIGAGGFGTRCACGLAMKSTTVDQLVLVDAKDQLAGIKKAYDVDAATIAVKYGTIGGAHRDWRTAVEQAKKDKGLNKLVKSIRKVSKEIYPEIPVVCWGLGGATGFATAYHLCMNLPYVVHVVTLPDRRREMDPGQTFQNAADQLRILHEGVDLLSTGKKPKRRGKNPFKYHPFLVNEMERAEYAGEKAAEIIASHEINDANNVSNYSVKKVCGKTTKVMLVMRGDGFKMVKMGKVIKKLDVAAKKYGSNYDDIKINVVEKEVNAPKVDSYVPESDDDFDDFFDGMV